MPSFTKVLLCVILVCMISSTPSVLGEPGYKYVEDEYSNGEHQIFHWNIAPGGHVTYEINRLGSSHLTGNPQFEAVEASFQTWEDDIGSYIDFMFGGMTDLMPTLATQHIPDGHNVVGWVNMGDTGVNGFTYFLSGPEGLTEADICLNDFYLWSTTGEQDALDVQNIMTHEAGHFLHLKDLYSSSEVYETMYGIADVEETNKRTLEWGDIAGVRFVYPNTIPVSPPLDSVIYEGDIASGTVDSDPRSDIIVSWVYCPTGENTIKYRFGFNINPDGQCSTWSATHNMDGTGGVGESTTGLGVAVTSLDGNPGLDLVFLWADDPFFDNTVYYKIGWNIGLDGTPSSWSQKKTAFSDGVGWYTSGAAVQFVNLDADSRPEMVVFWVDDASGANTIYWRVGWNVDTSGNVASWGNKQSKPGWVGDTTSGLGATFAYLGGDSASVEMVLFWIDNPGGANHGYCQIGWDVTANGNVQLWSDLRKIPGDWQWIGDSTSGCGVCSAQVGLTNTPDLIFMWIDDTSIDSACYRVQYETPANLPPDVCSKPSGPIVGFVGEDYSYTTQASDPDGDPVRYQFYWGDSPLPTITGYYSQGQQVAASHVWTTPGTYLVKTIARDALEVYSQTKDGRTVFSETLTVHILTGTCPYVCTWTGENYVPENNILPKSLSYSGTDSGDYYKLEHPMIPLLQDKSKRLYSLQILEAGNDHDYLDQLELLAIDHEFGTEIAFTPEGKVLTYSDPKPPLSCTDSNGRDCLSEIRSIDGDVANVTTYFDGKKGDYLTLDFGNISSRNAKLVVISDRKCEELPYCCIEIQLLHGNGWETISTIAPREKWATDAIYLPAYSGVGQNLTVRLLWTLPHRLDFVGLDTSNDTKFQIHSARLVSAIHSKEGDILSKLLKKDKEYSDLIFGQWIRLVCSVPSNQFEKRTFVLHSEGHIISPT